MSVWVRIERFIAYVVAYAAAVGFSFAVVAAVLGSLWWLFGAAAAAWVTYQTLDALIMTKPPRSHSCRRCGDSVTADPNPFIDWVRVWSWRLAHKLNCGVAS